MGFLDLFGAGGPLSLLQQGGGAAPTPATLLSAGGPNSTPAGNTGPYSPAGWLQAQAANPTSGAPNFGTAAPPAQMGAAATAGVFPEQVAGYTLPGALGQQIQSAGAAATPSFWSALTQPGGPQASGGLDQSTIAGLINNLLGPAPSIDQLFSSTPYNNIIQQLQGNKSSAASGISDAYSKALADLATSTAQAKQSQSQYAQQVASSGQQAQANQAAFLQSMGINGASGSGLGNALTGQAAQMAQSANEQNTMANTINQVQNNDLSHASQDATLGQMGSLNYLNAQTAGAQSKIGSQESTDYSTAMKTLGSLLTARTSQQSKLMSGAESFLSKTATNSTQAAQQQLAQMASAGDTQTPSAFNSIVYGGDPNGSGGLTAGAKNEAEALQRLQTAAGTLSQHGVDANALRNLIQGYYEKQPVPASNTVQGLQAYLAGL
jgi:hypothetical protein